MELGQSVGCQETIEHQGQMVVLSTCWTAYSSSLRESIADGMLGVMAKKTNLFND